MIENLERSRHDTHMRTACWPDHPFYLVFAVCTALSTKSASPCDGTHARALGCPRGAARLQSSNGPKAYHRRAPDCCMSAACTFGGRACIWGSVKEAERWGQQVFLAPGINKRPPGITTSLWAQPPGKVQVVYKTQRPSSCLTFKRKKDKW